MPPDSSAAEVIEVIDALPDPPAETIVPGSIRAIACAEMDEAVGGRTHFEAGDLVEYARLRPDSVLHRLLAFDRSDEEVAHQWRLHKARQLISLHRMVRQIQDARAAPPTRVSAATVRKFVHVPGAPGYTRRELALADPSMRKKLIDFALGELRSWCSRYGDVEELAGVRAKIERLTK